MNKNIVDDLPELIKAGVISEETSIKIRDYYGATRGYSQNRLFIAFGILGALLVGLGIILIIAHNWDELSRTTKTILAFLPIILGQVACGYTLIKQKDSIAWRESATTFLFFSVASCISLIHQIYNLPTNQLSTFILTWMLLCAPLIYLMQSSITSLLFWMGITFYACDIGYFNYPSSEPYLFFLLLSIAVPYYYRLFKKSPQSNFLIFHNWVVPLSLMLVLGTFASKTTEFMFIAYLSLFGIFYLMGNSNFLKQQKTRNNGYMVIGSLGTVSTLLMLSYDSYWTHLFKHNYAFTDVIRSPEFIAAVVLSAIATIIFVLNKRKGLLENNPIEFAFGIFILTFIIGLFLTTLSVVIINLLIFLIGLVTIRNGVRLNHLGIMNYGLLIIAALVISRFFDSNISFIIRGLLFVAVGVGFFMTNYRMLKRRKSEETNQ